MDDKPNHKTTVSEFLRSRSGHIEMFAAAYLKQTGLDPTKAKMIEKHETTDTGMIVTYWFEENAGVMTRIEQLEAEFAEWKQNAVNLAAENIVLKENIDKVLLLLKKMRSSEYQCDACRYSCNTCSVPPNHYALIDEAMNIFKTTESRLETYDK